MATPSANAQPSPGGVQAEIDLLLPLRRVAFVVFDVETTGLSPAYGDRVCEIACLRLEEGAVVGEFSTLVDPGRPISPGAFGVNHITAQMLRGAPLFEAIARPVVAMMDGAVLVAHNAPFDLGFLAVELEIARIAPPEGPVLDTLTLARRVYSFPRNSLDAVARALAIDSTPNHRALGDAWTTALVLERILWDLERRWGIANLGALFDFQGGPIPYPVQRAVPLPPTIAEAMASGGRVVMRYVDARGEETLRTIRPLRVCEANGYLYLVAHCYLAGEPRTFRLDRVVEMVLEESQGG